MRYILFFGLLVALSACQGQKQSSRSTRAATSTDTTADTLRSSTTNSEPAPGTVRVRATVRGCREEAEGYRCRFAVRKVIAYGAAAPVLGSGTTVAVRVARHWFDEPHQEREPGPPSPGSSLEVTLSHSEQPEFAEASGPPWRLEAIH